MTLASTETPIASRALEPGAYLLTAQVLIENTSSTVATAIRCFLRLPAGASGVDEGQFQPLEPHNGNDNVYRLFLILQGAVTLTSPATVTVTCEKDSDQEDAFALGRIFALKVGAVAIG